MVTPYLTFHGECEEAFNLYAKAFGGGKTDFVRLNNDPSNPIMHASVSFTKYDGCIMGADVKEPVVIFGEGGAAEVLDKFGFTWYLST